jgi:phosphoadenosine phosphosulfate reductase
VQATSLGVEGMVITDLIARHQLPVVVATLDTGALHAADAGADPAHRGALRHPRRALRARAGSGAALRARHGDLAMRQSVELRKACCALRKLEPMQRLLAGHDAWITGPAPRAVGPPQRREFARSTPDGRDKFYPLADWSLADVWHYVPGARRALQRLHDQLSPASAASPAPAPVAPGEDFRAGRWWWEQGEPRSAACTAGRSRCHA